MSNNGSSRIAIIGVIVSDLSQAPKLNALLSEYQEYILGRMGLPHQKNNLSLISIAIEAPGDAISALSGKIGMLPGVTSKVVYAE